jgi:hypothetical protein
MAAEQAKEAERDVVGTAAQTVFEDVDRALNVMDEFGHLSTGPAAAVTSWLPTTPADQLQKHIDSIKGNVGIDSLLKIKKSGAGLGHIPQAQLEMLASLLGKLDSNMKYEDLQYNLNRIGNIYKDIVEKTGGDPKGVYNKRRQDAGLSPDDGNLSSRSQDIIEPQPLSTGGSTVTPERVEELKKKYGIQ